MPDEEEIQGLNKNDINTDKDRIVSEALDLLNNEARFETMSKLHNPYGDGKACERIVEFIAQQEGKTILTETLVN